METISILQKMLANLFVVASAMAQTTSTPVQPKIEPLNPYRNLIADIAAPRGISIIKVEKIIEAESNFDPLAENPTSSAEGLGQILDGTWKFFKCTGDKKDPADSIRCMVIILSSKNGERHWAASQDKWGR